MQQMRLVGVVRLQTNRIMRPPTTTVVRHSGGGASFYPGNDFEDFAQKIARGRIAADSKYWIG